MLETPPKPEGLQAAERRDHPQAVILAMYPAAAVVESGFPRSSAVSFQGSFLSVMMRFMLLELPKAIECLNVGAGVQTQQIWLQGLCYRTLNASPPWAASSNPLSCRKSPANHFVKIDDAGMFRTTPAGFWQPQDQVFIILWSTDGLSLIDRSRVWILSLGFLVSVWAKCQGPQHFN